MMWKFPKVISSANKVKDLKSLYKDLTAVVWTLRAARLVVQPLALSKPHNTLRAGSSLAHQFQTISTSSSSWRRWPRTSKRPDWWFAMELAWSKRNHPITLCTARWQSNSQLISAGMLWTTVCRCMVATVTCKTTRLRDTWETCVFTRFWKELMKSWCTLFRGLCLRTDWFFYLIKT